MKYKIGFRLDWLEMIMVLAATFVGGIPVFSDMENKFVITGFSVLSAGVILMKKRIKMPIKNNESD